jgi:hypothetical protein
MHSAEWTKLLKCQFVRSLFFIFRGRIVSPFTLLTGQGYYIAHKEKSPSIFGLNENSPFKSKIGLFVHIPFKV